MSNVQDPVQPLRAGVIGLGWAGRQHMAAFAQEAGVELAALAGMEADPLQRLGDEYGVAAGAPLRRLARPRRTW